MRYFRFFVIRLQNLMCSLHWQLRLVYASLISGARQPEPGATRRSTGLQAMAGTAIPSGAT